MIASITEIISIVTIFQLLLFSLFLLGIKKKNRQSFKILSAFLFANALFILNFLIRDIEIFLNVSLIDFRFIGFSFGFLFGPLLFLYTKSLTKKDYSFIKKDLLHFLPFILYNILMIFNYHISSETEKINLLHNGNVLPHWLSISVMFSMHLQIFVYIFLSLQLLKDFRTGLKKVYSSIEKLNLTWLAIILLGFIFMWIIDFVHLILSLTLTLTSSVDDTLNFFSLSINFVFAFLIVYKGLRHPELFYELPEQTEKIKYEKSLLSKDESLNYLDSLKDYMLEEKPYLNPELTINDLAEKLNISSKTLSQVINENLNQNFFDFINSYRIAEAKQKLSNPEKKLTVLEILYSVGFNSKSAFNAAFRRHTGTTPTEYKNHIRKNITPVYRG